jgi:ribosome biogenesis GTPase
MHGRIVKGIAGFYYVYADDGNTYECKAKGIFRKDKQKPMVGDEVTADILDENERTGNITELLPRRNSLIRPAAANVDQALIVFALTHPEPNYAMLDKLLLQFSIQNVPAVIVFNKEDLVKDSEKERVNSIYMNSGAGVLFTCATLRQGIDELKDVLKGKLSCVAGPSGVGKSSLINCLQDGVKAATGDISHKAERGKHTTRHSEIIPISDDTFIMDTPGFSSFDVLLDDPESLKDHYEEFIPFAGCRFQPCSHTHEPDCMVKTAVERGLISRERYDNYTFIYSELKNLRRY